MPRAIHKLTPGRIQHKSRKPGIYGDGGGLYLRSAAPAASSWIFRYMLEGRAREMGLGSYPDISLDTARALARDARELKAGGVDPIAARDSVRASQRVEAARAITFRDCAASYIASQKGKWKNAKHAQQWSATLETHAMPILADIPVSAVDKGMVIKVLDPIWKTIPETAKRLRGRIEAVLDWAEMRDYRTGSNPAVWKGRLDKVFPARSKVRGVKHHPALPFTEASSFMGKLAAESGTASQALLFTILTAARTSETLAACWSEVDMNGSHWTVPASRMKGGREHRVPLSPQAMKVLRHQQKLTSGKGFIFPARNENNSLSNMAMLKVLERMKRSDLTVHGFRSTFRDWIEERTTYAGSVAEAALAHAVGDKVEAAYRRGDLFEKRRQLMNAWGRYCTAPAENPESGVPQGIPGFCLDAPS